MVDDKKKPGAGGGLMGWLRGDKRADETGKIAIVKLDPSGAPTAPVDASKRTQSGVTER